MKFPYGIFDFKEIVTQQYFYCDRTHFIRTIEDTGNYLLFIRPRRFGKSLLLSMLEHYYDVAQAERFRSLFGHLDIGNHPTPLHNQFFILKWDFSCVDQTGDVNDIRRSLHDHVNARIERFSQNYRSFFTAPILIDRDNAINSLESLIMAISQTQHPIYLLIDEYDNFANGLMMDAQDNLKTYQAIVYEKGPLKTLFKAVKSLSTSSAIARTFITGVSPVVLSDITSGYNIAENIYLNPLFNTLCGFEEKEVQTALSEIVHACGFDENRAITALETMRTWYNGYRFAADAEKLVYNPTLTLFFLKAFQQTCQYPRRMLDANLSADRGKLEYFAGLSAGRQMLLDIVNQAEGVTIPDVVDRFGVMEMISDQTKDQAFLASYLYYFGVLTLKGMNETLQMSLKVPNLVMKGLYIDRIKTMLLPEPAVRDEGRMAAEKLYMHGDMQPLCDFVEQKYFKVFHNRDYRWANELTVKTAFLTLLYNDILYVMDSETEISRRYADLTMIRRSDMRQVQVYDLLIEFKFVPLPEAGLSGEDARRADMAALRAIPAMNGRMVDALSQVGAYGEALQRKYGDLNLKRYTVVSLGYERIWWQELI